MGFAGSVFPHEDIQILRKMDFGIGKYCQILDGNGFQHLTSSE